MGSLPPQGSSGGDATAGGGGQVITSSQDEAFVAITTYANALVVDLQTIKDSVFQVFNTSGIALQYKVFASPKVQVSAPADADDSWRNILNGRTNTPSDYDHTLERTIPANGQQTESLDNAFAWARIQIKSASGTPTVKVWHRGTVP